MTELGQRVGQALVQNLPVPQKHPLRNYDPVRIQELMNAGKIPKFEFANDPNAYGEAMASDVGTLVLSLQKALSDPNSEFAQKLNKSLPALLGSQDSSMRLAVSPGRIPKNKNQYLAGTYAPKGFASGDIRNEIINAMGRGEELSKDAIMFSKPLYAQTVRHEFLHRGVQKLQEQGFEIDHQEEESVARILDFLLGDDQSKLQAMYYFDREYGIPMQEVMRSRKWIDLVHKVQSAAYDELKKQGKDIKYPIGYPAQPYSPIPQPSRELK